MEEKSELKEVEEKSYVYFISFVHSEGMANVEINLEDEISNIDIIGEIEKEIELNIMLQGVSIISFTLFRVE